ncbi:MarR family winged helix-turn-helix transcriptional regulator [Celeribacter indicus]|uniref:MarR family transcriptional regulator n=1 Tax=Celeribacter indicus TaxID=1208324 RepID=A0A0B5DXQ0_9RHOB|nr:MarR family winged helix-turn-helix transcriptional regulator [Celeribacter indicus]AJE45022.1 MarR family transcriptional regulator [Celeribacter indicus]
MSRSIDREARHVNLEELAGDEIYELVSHNPGHLLRRAYQVFLFFFDDTMKGLNMTPLLWILLTVTYCYPRRSVTDIAELSRIDKASCGRAATLLEKRGLMRIGTGEKDRRQRVLELTPHGHEVVLDGMSRTLEMQKKLLQCFDQEEARQFSHTQKVGHSRHS